MILFESSEYRASFYFAAEEYIMRVKRPDEPVLMLWSTSDTVMIGANQITRAECDEAYAKASAIEIVRRQSGGGTIYTDKGTLQYSIILPYGPADFRFPHMSNNDPKVIIQDWLVRPVTAALADFGIRASHEGRNDIVIDALIHIE